MTYDRDAPRRRGRPPGSSPQGLLDVARDELLEHGYPRMTMDAVARRAHVSKNSLYREFGSKERLYAAVVADWVERGRDAMRPHLEALLAADDVADGLLRLAAVLQQGVLGPDVTRMRTLVAAEATRAPDVAAAYVRDGWNSNITALATALGELMRRGSLADDDPHHAADQLTWLVLAAPMNRLTLTGGAAGYTRRQLDEGAREAVATFLARWAPPGRRGPSAGRAASRTIGTR
ncbi:MAG: TetR/AcrR family transcriptional regulator [Phycicoccus sp.]